MASERKGPLLPHGFLMAGLVLPEYVVPALQEEASKADFNASTGLGAHYFLFLEVEGGRGDAKSPPRL